MVPAAGCGEIRVDLRRRRRQWPAQQAEAAHESRLELPDCLALDAHHHIVKRAVEEVILDAGASDPGDPPVDHEQLAMIEASQLVEAPVDPPITAEQPVAVDQRRVVLHHLHASAHELVKEGLRLEVHRAAESVDHHANWDALPHLVLEDRRQLVSELARA